MRLLRTVRNAMIGDPANQDPAKDYRTGLVLGGATVGGGIALDGARKDEATGVATGAFVLAGALAAQKAINTCRHRRRGSENTQESGEPLVEGREFASRIAEERDSAERTEPSVTIG